MQTCENTAHVEKHSSTLKCSLSSPGFTVETHHIFNLQLVLLDTTNVKSDSCVCWHGEFVGGFVGGLLCFGWTSGRL